MNTDTMVSRMGHGFPSQECGIWDFPGGPVGKTPVSQSRGPGLGPGFDPWSGN